MNNNVPLNDFLFEIGSTGDLVSSVLEDIIGDAVTNVTLGDVLSNSTNILTNGVSNLTSGLLPNLTHAGDTTGQSYNYR